MTLSAFSKKMKKTFIVVQLVPVPVHHVGLQEVEESPRGEEAVRQGKIFDVTHVQGEGVGGRGDGAKGHQLAHNIPDTNT